jgi:hypothetical protein
MNRKVNADIIHEWIKQNGPDGMFRLAQKSGVSAWTIARVKTGYVPKKPITRRLLVDALETTEQALFPLVGARGKAS